MQVSKYEYKELYKEGNLNNNEIKYSIKYDGGLGFIDKGSSINLSILNNGLFFKVRFGDMYFLKVTDIEDIEVNKYKISIKTTIKDKPVSFLTTKPAKVYNSLVNLIGIEEVPEELFKLSISDRSNYFTEVASTNKITIPREPKKPKEVCCPKCGSTSLSANKKGFGLLKGAAGVLTFGAYGVVTAGIGKNKIIVTCLACGKQFKPGN